MKLFIYLLIIIFFSIYKINAQQVIEISQIPSELTWVNTPLSYKISDNKFIIDGGKGSRLFTDPQQKISVDTAPMALFKPDDNFIFSSKVKVDFNSKFDAGVLMVYANSDQWAKLCFEYSPEFKPMVVTVVNNTISDDSNHDIIDGNEVYLRIAGLGNGAYVFHYSLDGKYWNMVRYFYLNPENNLKIGFLSQSPTGDSCKTTFSEIKYDAIRLSDIRSGE